MLKITPAENRDHSVVLLLEGRVGGPWIAELRSICESLLEQGRPVTLNLANVSFLDHEGAQLLFGLRAHGVLIASGSQFVMEQLKAAIASP